MNVLIVKYCARTISDGQEARSVDFPRHVGGFTCVPSTVKHVYLLYL